MRIAVYTHPLFLNYGGILQAYALQRILQDMGHDAVYIEWCPYKVKASSLRTYLSRCFWKLFRDKNVVVFSEQRWNRACKKTRRFVQRNISIIPFADLCDVSVDALIVGSDQIWRPIYIANIEDAYLGFAKDWNVRRIAYAASFGVDDWSEYSVEQTAHCRELAQLFDAVSVREDSGVDLCRSYLGVEAKHVLDPTMLVDIKHYMCHISSCKHQYPRNMCLAYILDETDEKSNVLDAIVGSRKYNICQWKNIHNPSSKNPTVEEWLKGFHDAEFVFTDSFHGCVFSIIFNKPFIAFGNEGRGMARFNFLLRQFGLDRFLLKSKSDFSESMIYDVIAAFNSEDIQFRLNQFRAESYDFLLKALE